MGSQGLWARSGSERSFPDQTGIQYVRLGSQDAHLAEIGVFRVDEHIPFAGRGGAGDLQGKVGLLFQPVVQKQHELYKINI